MLSILHCLLPLGRKQKVCGSTWEQRSYCSGAVPAGAVAVAGTDEFYRQG